MVLGLILNVMGSKIKRLCDSPQLFKEINKWMSKYVLRIIIAVGWLC